MSDEYIPAVIDTWDPHAIRNLVDGRDGYVVPWAFLCDEDGRLYIRGDYTWHPRPAGTVNHKIGRRGQRIVTDEMPSTRPRAGNIVQAMVEWDAEPVYTRA